MINLLMWPTHEGGVCFIYNTKEKENAKRLQKRQFLRLRVRFIISACVFLNRCWFIIPPSFSLIQAPAATGVKRGTKASFDVFIFCHI